MEAPKCTQNRIVIRHGNDLVTATVIVKEREKRSAIIFLESDLGVFGINELFFSFIFDRISFRKAF